MSINWNHFHIVYHIVLSLFNTPHCSSTETDAKSSFDIFILLLSIFIISSNVLQSNPLSRINTKTLYQKSLYSPHITHSGFPFKSRMIYFIYILFACARSLFALEIIVGSSSSREGDRREKKPSKWSSCSVTKEYHLTWARSFLRSHTVIQPTFFSSVVLF